MNRVLLLEDKSYEKDEDYVAPFDLAPVPIEAGSTAIGGTGSDGTDSATPSSGCGVIPSETEALSTLCSTQWDLPAEHHR